MMNKDIQKNRDRIDAIDNQVFDLLIDRLDAVTTIGYIKKQEGLPVLDQNRESQIYAKIDAKFSAIEADFLKHIYQSIIAESKKVEEK
ncbi:MAG: chorismate mutase [Candidatus Marinimicrobia bacterium]|nr:chorismate mutase [Candidatus Neomarinimicrobiota bacterium]